MMPASRATLLLVFAVALPFTIGAFAGLNTPLETASPHSQLSDSHLRNFPPLPDFKQVADVKKKKALFFSYMQTLADAVNTDVKNEREFVNKVYEKNTLNSEEHNKLKNLSEKYRIDWPETGEKPEKAIFLRRIDTIPTSLILAQAANESAWGTSRFAREGNNLFGQWCFSKGCGIVPKHRANNAQHEVAKFDSPYDSVSSYVLNLNRHTHYQELRKIRSTLKQKGKKPTGKDLSQGLKSYSEKGDQYIEELNRIIRQNKLSRLDKVS